MLTNNFLALNWQATAMSKLALSFRKSNIDVTALLNKNGKLANDVPTSTENSKADTVELSNDYNETGRFPAKMDTIEDLIKYLKMRKQQLKDELPKPMFKSYAEYLEMERRNPNYEKIQRSNELAAKIQPIDNKIRMGKRPTTAEMNFIREHAPELYRVALQVQQEMEQFRKQLDNCETKEAEGRVIMQKAAQLHATSKVDPAFALYMMAAMIEHLKVRMPNSNSEFEVSDDNGQSHDAAGTSEAIENHEEEVEMPVTDNDEKKQGTTGNRVTTGTQARQVTTGDEFFKTDSFNSAV